MVDDGDGYDQNISSQFLPLSSLSRPSRFRFDFIRVPNHFKQTHAIMFDFVNRTIDRIQARIIQTIEAKFIFC